MLAVLHHHKVTKQPQRISNPKSSEKFWKPFEKTIKNPAAWIYWEWFERNNSDVTQISFLVDDVKDDDQIEVNQLN